MALLHLHYTRDRSPLALSGLLRRLAATGKDMAAIWRDCQPEQQVYLPVSVALHSGHEGLSWPALAMGRSAVILIPASCGRFCGKLGLQMAKPAPGGAFHGLPKKLTICAKWMN